VWDPSRWPVVIERVWIVDYSYEKVVGEFALSRRCVVVRIAFSECQVEARWDGCGDASRVGYTYRRYERDAS
jgi:hypothetical protein